jgi:hypothetical protein
VTRGKGEDVSLLRMRIIFGASGDFAYDNA